MAEDGDIPTVVRVMKAGATDFLEKPCRSEALLAAIEAALVAPGPHIVDVASEAAARIAVLPPREGEILDRLAAGMPNKAIARELGLSPRTVEVRRARLMKRLGVGSLAEAVRLVVQAELGLCSREGDPQT
jgi:two-component system, LuxR family, response regulator FixJ